VARRHETRLRNFAYGAGYTYFVTICTGRRGAVFGVVRDGAVLLNRLGRLVLARLREVPDGNPGVDLDEHIVMPDHVHAILVFDGGARDGARQASPLRLGAVVGSFKSGVAREARTAVWQRGFYDHVIRDEADLARIRDYIVTNPARWSDRS
jgi:REP element-mobilizing transposase RayT